jgi:GNAT superfamily N-acetyltransferase
VRAGAAIADTGTVLPMRERYREEMNCQIVHDSIHSRPGWSQTYLLTASGHAAGFAGVAVAGPWTGRPTIYELYISPAYRTRAFDLFEALLDSSGAVHIEAQSNDLLLTAMLHTFGRDVWSEAIVFRDHGTTSLPADGVTLRELTTHDQTRRAIEERAGATEWVLERGGRTVARGAILFHYNRPYADVAMDVDEPYRRQGYGAYLVQELKRIAYGLGAIPGARCNRDNIASRRTLQKAGFVPFAHILNATLPGR